MSISQAPTLQEMLAHAAEVLPSQSPLHAFVHHNTLHAYEHLPFKEALKEASREYNAEPFMSEEQFLTATESGRIQLDDIKAVLDREIDDLDEAPFAGAPTRRALLLWRLTTLFNVPTPNAINWWLHEKGYLRTPHKLAGSAAGSAASSLFFQSKRQYLPKDLASLWQSLERNAEPKSRFVRKIRPRDLLFEVHDIDTDEQVKPFLIRHAAAYLDQGVGTLPQPDKDKGFLESFRRMHAGTGLTLPSWLHGLSQDCARQLNESPDALAVIAEVIQYFGVPVNNQQGFLVESLKMLKGWAGMFHQFELQPDKVPVNPFPATLADFLAVQLMLEKHAFINACRGVNFCQLQYSQILSQRGAEYTEYHKPVQDTYEAFVTAQAFDLPAALFAHADNARKWIAEIGSFNSFERRYLLQLAYERRHRHHVLDGLQEHQKFVIKGDPRAANSFQAVFCMDEREESTRRHLEELTPNARTYGFAGFFGVAMQYQGFDDVTSRPLCPVNRKPIHLVREIALDAHQAQRYQEHRQRKGSYSKQAHKHESLVTIGPFWSLLMGAVKAPSLIFRSLSPRLTETTKRRFAALSPSRPATRLQLFRTGNEKEADMFVGYSISEAADATYGMLAAMGMRRGLSRCVFIVGHGSSSLNNPHEAAHDCGATGGGRGGPNARAFAAMANHPDVRMLLLEKGIEITSDTWFVGAYHNTCDDSMDYYDVDLVPETHKPALAEIQQQFAAACKLDALERCRKFEEVPVDVDNEEALGFAYQHSIDLAQPRPEYGHATNAVCIIGRREKTKGLFLDRRSFLISYDPAQDPDASIVAGILETAGPVGAGINLEYYFSFIDPIAYGCGTKLPHNISGLLGVMEGHSSDLRTGLPWQMVEIHEPVRLLTIVEASPETLSAIAAKSEVVGTLVGNGWIQLVSMHPDTGKLTVFDRGEFVAHQPESSGFPIVSKSETHFKGSATYLGLAHIATNPMGGDYA